MKNVKRKSAANPGIAWKILSGLTLMLFLCGAAVFMGSATFRVYALNDPAGGALQRMPAPPLPPVAATPAPVQSSLPRLPDLKIIPKADADPTEIKNVPGSDVASIEDAVEPELATEEEPAEPILASVSLDADTQIAIYNLCGGDDALFCAVMAIAREETGFTPDALGDCGRCVGMMQINSSFHQERMEKLGVTDLMDPVQCAAVAIDYIQELSLTFGWVDNHPLYLAYNAGPVGASNLNQIGVYSTRYTYEVLRYFNEFMEEMNPTETEEGGT